MTILDELLEKTKTLPVDEQLRQVCDDIQAEEQLKFKDFVIEMPTGPNIFLSIMVPGVTKKEICFVCLEREFPGQFIASFWTKMKDKENANKKPIKRMKVWEIKESIPKKIMQSYADKLNFMRGK
jgi:hypothetical protein